MKIIRNVILLGIVVVLPVGIGIETVSSQTASPNIASPNIASPNIASPNIASPNIASPNIASHRAVYDVEVLRLSSSSQVQSINGSSEYSIQRLCDGWQSVEHSAIALGFYEGSSNFVSQHKSWEALNGKAFSFSIYEDSTAKGIHHYEGFANLNEDHSEAYFTNETQQKLTLPEGTVFPIAHITETLENIRLGDKMQQSMLFLGGEREDSLYLVSSIAADKKTGEVPELLGPLGEAGYWPLRLAYFKVDTQEIFPDYEIEYQIQNNGVIRSYVVDYGDFSIRGQMRLIEPLVEPEC